MHKAHSRQVPCKCALRNLFRAVLGRYRREQIRMLDARRSWRRWSRSAEFLADVVLSSMTRLSERDAVIFREHFLEGRPWYEVCRRVHLDRGNFFHAVYSIEARLGRLYAELQPFSLFPTDGYFLPTIQRAAAVPPPVDGGSNGKWWMKTTLPGKPEEGTCRISGIVCARMSKRMK